MKLEDELQWRMPFTRYEPTYLHQSQESFMRLDKDGDYVELSEVMEVINLYKQEVNRLRAKLEMVNDEELRRV